VAFSGIAASATIASVCTTLVVTNALSPLINATLQAVPSAALPANFYSLLANNATTFCTLGSSRRALAGAAAGVRALQSTQTLRIALVFGIPASAGAEGVSAAQAAVASIPAASFAAAVTTITQIVNGTIGFAGVSTAAACAGGGSACSLPAAAASNSLSGGAIAGIVIGSVAFVAIVIGVSVYCLRKRSRAAASSQLTKPTAASRAPY
jgi:hypothetical protein